MLQQWSKFSKHVKIWAQGCQKGSQNGSFLGRFLKHADFLDFDTPLSYNQGFWCFGGSLFRLKKEEKTSTWNRSSKSRKHLKQIRIICPKGANWCPTGSPRTPQNWPESTKTCVWETLRFPLGPKLPRRVAQGAKMTPKWFQNDPKIVPKWHAIVYILYEMWLPNEALDWILKTVL